MTDIARHRCDLFSYDYCKYCLKKSYLKIEKKYFRFTNTCRLRVLRNYMSSST